MQFSLNEQSYQGQYRDILRLFRAPQKTTTERDAIKNPQSGQIIYNTTTNKLNVYTTAWEAITST